jgi:hypothetical protein
VFVLSQGLAITPRPCSHTVLSHCALTVFFHSAFSQPALPHTALSHCTLTDGAEPEVAATDSSVPAGFFSPDGADALLPIDSAQPAVTTTAVTPVVLLPVMPVTTMATPEVVAQTEMQPQHQERDADATSADSDATTADPYDGLQLSLLKYQSGKWFGKAFGKGMPLQRLEFEAFVKPNFGIEDGGVFIRGCRAKPGKLCPIPEGDARVAARGMPEKDIAALPLDRIQTSTRQVYPGAYGLVVKFQQGKVPTCVFSSAASAIHAFGDERAATKLAEYTTESINYPNRMHFLHATVKQCVKGWCPRQLPNDAALAFNCLVDRSWYPICVLFLGSDGQTSHCITILADLIFDSNAPQALPLCQHSLDLCAGYPAATFVQCVKVLCLEPGKRRLRILGKRKRE